MLGSEERKEIARRMSAPPRVDSRPHTPPPNRWLQQTPYPPSGLRDALDYVRNERERCITQIRRIMPSAIETSCDQQTRRDALLDAIAIIVTPLD